MEEIFGKCHSTNPTFVVESSTSSTCTLNLLRRAGPKNKVLVVAVIILKNQYQVKVIIKGGKEKKETSSQNWSNSMDWFLKVLYREEDTKGGRGEKM